MEVEIISKGCIKPCSSTPSHLKTYKISLLDQFMPPNIFFCPTLFYPNTNNNISQRSLVLKNSLSKTLSHFYPLAGRIKDHLSIDCNDQGPYYSEAKANISMSEYLTQPDLKVLNKLVPDFSSFNVNPVGAFVVMIQETTFACGGLAIGLSVSHMVIDGIALASFIKAWASAASSSSKQITSPNFDSGFVFPQYEGFPKEALFPALWSPFVRKEKIAVRRLMFGASAIGKLKAKASSSGIENPSRVEVVSAIISKTVKAALKNKAIAIGHAVNMRRKATPPFPDSSLGNYLWPVHAIIKDKEIHSSSLVQQIRNSIRKIDREFVNNAIEGGVSKLSQELKKIGCELCVEGMKFIGFSSMCNSGLYNNSDFGWGKPIWIAKCSMIDCEEIAFYNMCNLVDTRSGNGVEAWLYLPQHVTALVEKDDDLLQYALINPSPLNIVYSS